MWYVTKSKKHMYFKTKNKLGLTFENCWRSRTCRSLAKCFRNRDKHFGPHVSKWNPVEWSISTYITLIKVIISLLDSAPLYIFLKKEALSPTLFRRPIQCTTLNFRFRLYFSLDCIGNLRRLFLMFGFMLFVCFDL